MERINVAVRARPLSPEDAKTSPWRISGNSIVFANPSTKFEFDRIFREDCKTADVYESRTKAIVSAAIGGFNGTVFAYGQTNSGKTHTMRGSSVEPGVIPLAVHDLFDMIQQEIDREFLLRMSYMEIYNEEINDLLAPEHRKLQIHESIERGIFVAGLKEEIVSSPEQVLKFMEFGEAHRHIGETNMNLHSSRSHTIFRMIIESRDKVEDEYAENSCDAVRVSVLNLVDLAGSERAAKTGAEGVRLKEGSHINKSLMTLGTVIKKLSEGAESQGGHVPYRDSKLTRILQPALGGNANTAIICNITLAQIHADETKSSLMFASRALRVTNCVHVNEILTDAALLKRQKKEIEELRAKLQGSHSDHLGEEILNLRNTLLQSELERERIALELEEEKKAQAERDKMLLEQAKKIQNLSSMVLSSNRDEVINHRKEKRRETWCPGKLPEKMVNKLPSTIRGQASAVKPVKNDRERGPLLPFEELVNDNSSNALKHESEESDRNKVGPCNFSLPNPRSLIHVTSRRKASARKKSLPVESAELTEMQEEYENLLIQFETQRTKSEIEIAYLTRRLVEANNTSNTDEKANEIEISMLEMERLQNLESAIVLETKKNIDEKANEMEGKNLVIKQLQEKISMLEMERLQNLESAIVLETEKNKHASNKQEEDEKLSADLQEVESEVQHSKTLVQSMMDEHLQTCSELSELIAGVRSFSSIDFIQIKTLLAGYGKVNAGLKSKVDDLEREKLLMYNQSEDLQKKIEEAFLNSENSARDLTELSERYETEKNELISEIVTLQDEISRLSSSILFKEKESLRKDLEKTKAKLKETESKLRNTIQEKTKLEGEKASAEREIKRLHSQKAILERDMTKRETIAGRRRDSVMDRSSNIFDSRKVKGSGVDQEEYRKLEVLAFEMETTIGSLEEKLAIANDETQQAVFRSETLIFEVEELTEKLNFSNSELQKLEELVSSLRAELEEVAQRNENADSSISRLLEEKEEMAMQLTDALLAIEEERAIWSTTEKASVEAIENKAKSCSTEIALLTDAMSKAKDELEVCREECQVISEKLAFAEEKVKAEKVCSAEKSLEVEQLKNDIKLLDDQRRLTEDALKSKLETLSLDHRNACEKVDKLMMDLDALSKERDDLAVKVKEFGQTSVPIDDFKKLQNQLLEITKERDEVLTQIQELQNHKAEQQLLMEKCNEKLSNLKAEVEDLKMKLSTSTLEPKIHIEGKNSRQSAKLRMRLHGAQTKLDSIRVRCKEQAQEKEYMHKQFEEATMKLKKELVSRGSEILNLKKQLVALSS
ncbi:putative plus-end-directed kinesin ATPase [Helianthus annuus]|uniref:Plus-end-directed kinesin ATPase n=1 Tax=Helianthus annuus TaxID=4232 RepID=A0A251SV79_HELAN|nr:putative plus-end-directed kinesin ATPase [Helianthus annuus]KAJ0850437.1 putative plus-end-directed kinesin ATPase [Helianthus annuus]